MEPSQFCYTLSAGPSKQAARAVPPHVRVHARHGRGARTWSAVKLLFATLAKIKKPWKESPITLLWIRWFKFYSPYDLVPQKFPLGSFQIWCPQNFWLFWPHPPLSAFGSDLYHNPLLRLLFHDPLPPLCGHLEAPYVFKKTSYSYGMY